MEKEAIRGWKECHSGRWVTSKAGSWAEGWAREGARESTLGLDSNTQKRREQKEAQGDLV